MATEQITRNVCAYLGFHADLPMGSRPDVRDLHGQPQFDRRGRYCGRWRVHHDAEEGTLAEDVAGELEPLYEATGERLPDGRQGRQAIIESLLKYWPSVPPVERCSAYDLRLTFGGREWLSQGQEWEYVEISGRAVYAALLSGESPGSIRRRILMADPSLVTEHRHYATAAAEAAK